MVITGVNREAIKVSLFALLVLKEFVKRRKTMINGTCVHCDAEQDLVPICISCAKDKVTMVAEKSRNVPLKDVSQDLGSPTQETIKKVLNRLKNDCGFGVPDGHE